MDKILLTAPSSLVPPAKTQAYRVLSLFEPDKPLIKMVLTTALGDDPRSALQSLTGPKYGYWLIHNIGEKKGVYMLDGRHFSCDVEQDTDARVEARKRLCDRSRSQCEKELMRYERAIKEQKEALLAFQERFDFED
jgi:hypothetical protein